jgi:hypothetical protein
MYPDESYAPKDSRLQTGSFLDGTPELLTMIYGQLPWMVQCFWVLFGLDIGISTSLRCTGYLKI